MKNIIDFILESKGQRPRFRETNKPYNAENDELVHNKDTREYKKDLQRLTAFFNEFNANLDEKYKGLVHAFVFVGRDRDWFGPKFSTQEFVEDTKTQMYKSALKFSGSTDTKLSNGTIDNYDVLKNPDWMTLCDFKKRIRTPRHDLSAYELQIKNKYVEYENHPGGIYVTKDGINYFEYHDTTIVDLQLVFTIDKDNGVNQGEDWQPGKMIKSICNRVYKKNGKSNTVINLKELGKGNLTGKNFAEAFNHVFDTW